MQAGEPDILKHANPADAAPGSWDKRTALRSTMQRAAMADALRCDGRCTALRWPMHCAASKGRRYCHRAGSTPVGFVQLLFRLCSVLPVCPSDAAGISSYASQNVFRGVRAQLVTALERTEERGAAGSLVQTFPLRSPLMISHVCREALFRRPSGGRTVVYWL